MFFPQDVGDGNCSAPRTLYISGFTHSISPSGGDIHTEQAQNLSFLVTSLSTTYDLRELSTEEGATVLDESSPVKVDAASGNLTACLRDDAPGATTLSITLTDSDGGVSEPLIVNLIVDYVNQKPSFTLGPPSSLGSVGEAGEAGAVAAVVVWQGEGMTSVPAFARNIFKGNPSGTGQ